MRKINEFHTSSPNELKVELAKLQENIEREFGEVVGAHLLGMGKNKGIISGLDLIVSGSGSIDDRLTITKGYAIETDAITHAGARIIRLLADVTVAKLNPGWNFNEDVVWPVYLESDRPSVITDNMEYEHGLIAVDAKYSLYDDGGTQYPAIALKFSLVCSAASPCSSSDVTLPDVEVSYVRLGILHTAKDGTLEVINCEDWCSGDSACKSNCRSFSLNLGAGISELGDLVLSGQLSFTEHGGIILPSKLMAPAQSGSIAYDYDENSVVIHDGTEFKKLVKSLLDLPEVDAGSIPADADYALQTDGSGKLTFQKVPKQFADLEDVGEINEGEFVYKRADGTFAGMDAEELAARVASGEVYQIKSEDDLVVFTADALHTIRDRISKGLIQVPDDDDAHLWWVFPIGGSGFDPYGGGYDYVYDPRDPSSDETVASMVGLEDGQVEFRENVRYYDVINKEWRTADLWVNKETGYPLYMKTPPSQIDESEYYKYVGDWRLTWDTLTTENHVWGEYQSHGVYVETLPKPDMDYVSQMLEANGFGDWTIRAAIVPLFDKDSLIVVITRYLGLGVYGLKVVRLVGSDLFILYEVEGMDDSYIAYRGLVQGKSWVAVITIVPASFGAAVRLVVCKQDNTVQTASLNFTPAPTYWGVLGDLIIGANLSSGYGLRVRVYDVLNDIVYSYSESPSGVEGFSYVGRQFAPVAYEKISFPGASGSFVLLSNLSGEYLITSHSFVDIASSTHHTKFYVFKRGNSTLLSEKDIGDNYYWASPVGLDDNYLYIIGVGPAYDKELKVAKIEFSGGILGDIVEESVIGYVPQEVLRSFSTSNERVFITTYDGGVAITSVSDGSLTSNDFWFIPAVSGNVIDESILVADGYVFHFGDDLTLKYFWGFPSLPRDYITGERIDYVYSAEINERKSLVINTLGGGVLRVPSSSVVVAGRSVYHYGDLSALIRLGCGNGIYAPDSNDAFTPFIQVDKLVRTLSFSTYNGSSVDRSNLLIFEDESGVHWSLSGPISYYGNNFGPFYFLPTDYSESLFTLYADEVYAIKRGGSIHSNTLYGSVQDLEVIGGNIRLLQASNVRVVRPSFCFVQDQFGRLEVVDPVNDDLPPKLQRGTWLIYQP